MYRVVIVEDDAMIAMLDRAYVERDGRFQVAQVFSNGRDALSWLGANPVDLLVLDVYMPALTGVELLARLRAGGCRADVIMVTAAHEAETLDALMKLGILDYLVKPFAKERFQQALDGFCRHREALDGGGRVSQTEIDRLLFPPQGEGAAIPKGFQEKTLERLREVLRRAGGERTSEALAEAAGLSVVTVRRYMAYLAERGEAASRVNYDTGGRPCMLYRAKPQGAPPSRLP